MLETIGLREYQRQGIADLRAGFDAGAQRAILCFPTGAGKTVTAAAMIRDAMAENKSVFFIVHRQELCHQASRTLTAFGIAHGIIASGLPQTDDPIQVVMAQTLMRRLYIIKPPDLLVVDEAHHSLANTWKAIIKAYPGAKTVGLTATPQRLDGQGLAELYDAMVVGPSVQSLIEQGHLSDFEVYAPPIGISTEGIHTRAGDFAPDELANAIDKPTITGDAVATYMRLAAGKRAIVFCVSIKHSKNICAEFQSRGINAAHIDGNEHRVRREQIVEAFAVGKLQVLCNVELVSEGFDVPAAEVVIMLRPTKSLGLYLQQAGRALRPKDGKMALILDHAANAIRHGLPDEQHDWSLDSKKRKQSASRDNKPTAWQCPICDRVLPVHFLVCSTCGHITDRSGRVVAVQDGELEKIDRAALAKLRNLTKTGMGLREYARYRGVSSAAVGKAIKSGRIQKELDGTIDPVKADADWAANTNQAQQRTVRNLTKTGMGLREYARQRGVTEGAVRKAVKSGRILVESDGTIDPVKADADWAANTNQAQQRTVRNLTKTGMGLREYARYRGVSSAAVSKAIKHGRIEKEQDGTIDSVKADATWDRKRQKSGMTVAEYAKHRCVGVEKIYNALRIGLIHKGPDGSIDPNDADSSFQRESEIKSNKHESERKNNKSGMSVAEYAKYRGVHVTSVFVSLKVCRIQRELDGSIDPVKADAAWPRKKEVVGMSVAEYAKYRRTDSVSVYLSLKVGRIQRELDGSIDPVKADAAWPRIKDTMMTIYEYAKHRKMSINSIFDAVQVGRVQREPDGSIDPVKADAAWPRKEKTWMTVLDYSKRRGVSKASVLWALKNGRIHQEPDGSIDPVKADATWVHS